jgi:hypothetical protein
MLNALQKMEDGDARGEGYSRGIIGERVCTGALLGKPEKFLELLPVLALDISADRRAQIAARLQSGKLKAEEACYNQAVQKLLQVRQQPFPERLKADDWIRQQIAEADSKQLVISSFLLAGLRTEAAKEAECLASLRLGLTAVALEQFRALHDHRYPASLAELTPSLCAATPTDPYDGQPLRYKTKNDGYLLYSIGPDLKDDAGQRMNGREGDIVFAVVAPARGPR